MLLNKPYSTGYNRVLHLRFPFKPISINEAYSTVSTRRVLTKIAKLYKRNLVLMASNQIAHCGFIPPTKNDWIEIQLTQFFTQNRQDIDNGVKLTQDAITELLRVNDNRVIDLHIAKRFADEELTLFSLYVYTDLPRAHIDHVLDN